MKSLSEYLNESLMKHIALEIKDEDLVYEKYGEYDGCNELASYIEKRIKETDNKSFTIKYSEVKDIPNICFNVLKVEIINNDNSYTFAAYNVDNEKNKNILDEKTNKLKKCIIKINLGKEIPYSLHSIIEHELTHLYNDWLLQVKAITTFYKIFNNDKYLKSKEFNKLGQSLNLRQFKLSLYLLNKYEKNGFIAQLMGQIRDLKGGYKNHIKVKDILKDIKQLNIYKAYMNIGDYIYCYKNGYFSEIDKEEICNEYNKINNTKLSINQIFKKLELEFIKTKNKIESLIPKKISEDVYHTNEVLLDGECMAYINSTWNENSSRKIY